MIKNNMNIQEQRKILASNTKGRLFENFEKVNKVKLNEDFGQQDQGIQDNNGLAVSAVGGVVEDQISFDENKVSAIVDLYIKGNTADAISGIKQMNRPEKGMFVDLLMDKFEQNGNSDEQLNIFLKRILYIM